MKKVKKVQEVLEVRTSNFQDFFQHYKFGVVLQLINSFFYFLKTVNCINRFLKTKNSKYKIRIKIKISYSEV
jgi:hypothetical protein